MKSTIITLMAVCLLILRADGQNITQAEYFVDTDPGTGLGTSINIGSPATNVSGITFNVNISAASLGFHRIFLRTKDANGKWSHTNSILLYKTSNAPGVLPNITAAEYFIDTDPGIGSATTLPVSSAINISGKEFNAAIGALSTGFHRIYIRTKDANGRWSHTNSLLLYKKFNASETVYPITAAEYFIDTDPGTGNGIPVALQEATNLSTKQLYMNVTGLGAGTHHFYLRTKDASGVWSLTNTEEFTINSLTATPALVVNSISRTQICARDSFMMGYQVTGSYNAGNTFKVYLSNNSGSFTSETEIGTVTATTSGLIKCKLPNRVPDGNGYKLRIKSSNPVLTGVASNTSLTLYDRPDWGKDTTIYIVCQGEKVNLLPVFNTTGFTVVWNTPTPGDVGAGVYRLTSINAYGCTDTVYATVKQDVGTWSGVSGNNWHTPSNWSNGHIPTEKTHVIIPAGTPNPCVLKDANGIAASIQVKPGGILQVINSRPIEIKARCNPLPAN